MGYFTKVSTNKFPSFSDVYEDKQSSTQDNTTNLDPSGAYFYYIYIWNYNRLELVSSIKKIGEFIRKNIYRISHSIHWLL